MHRQRSLTCSTQNQCLQPVLFRDRSPKSIRLLQSSEVIAADGTLMGKYYLENGNRSNVEYKDISKNVLNALVATEDERFYSHSGVDMKGTVRAIVLLGSAGGGSTITQQLAKVLLHQGRGHNIIKRIIE